MQASNRASALRAAVEPALLEAGHDVMHDCGELSLVHAPGAPVEVRVAELPLLELGQQLVLVDVEIHRDQPRPQQRERIACLQVGSVRAVPGIALGHHPLDDLQDRCWIGAHWSVAAAGAERADRERHRCVRPLRGAALLPVRGRATGADVREELVRGGGARGLGERPADIDSGVVIGPSDGGSPVGLDVHERRKIEFLGPRAVARLPDREQLGQTPPVARGERRGDGVEGMSERGRDLVVVQVRGARLDVVAVGLQPFVIVRGDAVTEDVHGLSLAFERRGQLLGDERVGQVAERQDPSIVS